MPSLQLASVFRWNIRCTFMAILSVRADFCQAQHSVFADKYPSADIEAQVEFGFKWILNTSAYLEERSFLKNKQVE
ncbi:Nck-Associated Protein 1-Like [Manis pentadactyla]|nr:Nck-Associated Protein 1-Like [Manis pentadactyla]